MDVVAKSASTFNRWYVTDTGTIVLNGIARKYLDVYSDSVFALQTDRWIEGFGSIRALDAPYRRSIGWEFNTLTICLHDLITNQISEPYRYSSPSFDCNSDAFELDEIGIPQLHIWPNPFANSLSLEFEKPFSGILEIKDLSGKCLVQKQIANKVHYQLNSANLPKRIYILSLKNSSTSQVSTIIKS